MIPVLNASASVRLLIVRHGETPYNRLGRVQGRVDIPMSAHGERQIVRLSQRIACDVDVAYTSPLLRASQSAQLLIDSREIALHDAPDLAEMHYGAWQGAHEEEWPPGASEQWREDPWQVVFPDGESLPALRTRVHRTLTDITRKHQGQRVLLSTHGLVARLLIAEAQQRSPQQFWALRIPNAAAWWVQCRVDDDGTLHLSDARSAEAVVTPELARLVVDSKTKPQGSLGVVESLAVQLAVLQQSLCPVVDRARLCVFGADHGVTNEGVSAYPSAVTAEMMRNFASGGAAINAFARANDVELEVVDVGVASDLPPWPGVRREKVRAGTANFRWEAAMTEADLLAALAVGAQAVRRAASAGVDAVGLGEMGIGNSTSAAALLAALTGAPAAETVGTGTGVHGDALSRKQQVVEAAIALHSGEMTRSGKSDAREWVRRVGGLEIAAMIGAAIESTDHDMVLVADGFISTVAVLGAVEILNAEEPKRVRGLFARLVLAHRSTERGVARMLERLTQLAGTPQQPVLDLSMRLGEGTGAALVVPLLRASAAMMRDMATFSEAAVSTASARAP